MKLTAISLNLLIQAHKQDKLEKDSLIKFLVSLATVRSNQSNLSHEKFKVILGELKSESPDVLKRVCMEQQPWLKILEQYLNSVKDDEKAMKQMLVKLSHAFTKQLPK